jgi:hypothetical protein
VEIPSGGTLLKWELSAHQFQSLKSKHPRVRLDIITTEPTNLGFALLDSLDFFKGINQQWFRIQHGKGEVRVSVSCHETILGSLNPNRSTGTAHTRPTMQGSVGDSMESALSLSQIAGASVSSAASRTNRLQPVPVIQANKEKFTVTVAFEEYSGVNALLQTLFPDASQGATDRKYWFSWILFGQTFQSSEFTAATLPKRVKDAITIRCPPGDLVNMVGTTLPFQCCLCAAGGVLVAVATITFDLSGLVSSANQHRAWSEGNWFSVAPLSGDEGAVNNCQASVRVGIEVVAESADRHTAPAGSSRITETAGASPAHGGTAAVTAKQDPPAGDANADGDDGYDQDEFEEDPADASQRAASLLPNESSSHEFAAAGAGYGHSQGPGHGHGHGTTTTMAQAATDPVVDELDDSLSDEVTHHFRVSVTVHSITNLRRPAHIITAFGYPHLGTIQPVKSQPIWVQAYSDTRIEKGIAVYNCQMSRAEFKSVTENHSLKISVLTRTNLGQSVVGDCVLDLNAVYVSPIHSVRDPVTNRTFKTVEEFRTYRRNLVSLRKSGVNIAVPPVEPAQIHVSDCYLGISPVDKETSASLINNSVVEGASLRVVTIVEDIGVVGPEIAVNVKKGYQQQGGAFYDLASAETGDAGALTIPTLDANNNAVGTGTFAGTAFSSPHLAQLTPELRAKFDELMDDWMRWQRATEHKWREQLREEEVGLRRKLEQENANNLHQRMDDLKRGQDEVARLEIRLKEKMSAVDKLSNKLELQEEKLKKDLASRSEDLQMLQRRVRDEAKIRVEAEARKAEGLEASITSLRQQLDAMERRAKDSERDFESYRHSLRQSPEHVLREEVARLKAVLGETRADLERERSKVSKLQLEEEHSKTLIHRLALELKREREKSSITARQDIEQLRLEFLAREERYMLDGDRNGLQDLRNMLAALRANEAISNAVGSGNVNSNPQPPPPPPSQPPLPQYGVHGNTSQLPSVHVDDPLQSQLNAALASGLYTESDPLIMQMKQELMRRKQARWLQTQQPHRGANMNSTSTPVDVEEPQPAPSPISPSPTVFSQLSRSSAVNNTSNNSSAAHGLGEYFAGQKRSELNASSSSSNANNRSSDQLQQRAATGSSFVSANSDTENSSTFNTSRSRSNNNNNNNNNSANSSNDMNLNYSDLMLLDESDLSAHPRGGFWESKRD